MKHIGTPCGQNAEFFNVKTIEEYVYNCLMHACSNTTEATRALRETEVFIL
jgi:hypothetical protein